MYRSPLPNLPSRLSKRHRRIRSLIANRRHRRYLPQGAEALKSPPLPPSSSITDRHHCRSPKPPPIADPIVVAITLPITKIAADR